MKHKKVRRGFTLIEVLVVVLIIGILAAIALPMYNKAVLRSRFNALMPIVKAMNDSNEAYYLEHGSYASNPQDLPVQGLSEYPTGTELEFGSNMDYAYVLASNASAKNNYIMYQKHSTNYPGEIHCEAVTGDDLAEYICVSAGGTTNLGTTLTEGYTTYVISGSGAGVPTGTFEEAEDNANPLSCDKAISMGFTCTADEDTKTKTVCKELVGLNYCRTKTYHEDGSYTSVTCDSSLVDSGGRCSRGTFVTYDANGNKISLRTCASIAQDGSCSTYASGGKDWIYDKQEGLLVVSQRDCSAVMEDGHCSRYASSNAHDYTYDSNGNMISERECKTVHSLNGACRVYQSNNNYDYTYDKNGNKLFQRRCGSIADDGSCSIYSTSDSFDYIYDTNGNLIAQRECNSFAEDGSCGTYKTSANWDYKYDENGNQISARRCYRVAEDGICRTSYTLGYDYTYDVNGNRMSQRLCTDVDPISSGGNCKRYDSTNYNYDYEYDVNGKQISILQCVGMETNGTCNYYGNTIEHYVYDDDGNQMFRIYCGSTNTDHATGECLGYNGGEIYGN